MKKLLTAMTAIGVLTGASIAQDVVTSVNIVGYKKHTFESGKFYLVSTQFESIDGSPVTPNSAIGDQLPFGSDIFAWDAKKNGVGGYDSATYTAGGFGLPDQWTGSVVLSGTQGFWIRPGGSGSHEVAFLGEVPLDPTVTNILAESFTMTAYPFTADVAFSNTVLYADSEIGDAMYIWDSSLNGGSGGYFTSTKVAGGFGLPTQWSNGGEELIISQGTGIWYDHSGTGDRVIAESRPYNP